MDFLDSAIEFASDGVGGLLDSIGSEITTAISNFVGMLLYYLTFGLMWFVSILQQLFDVFSGTSKVRFNKEYTYLTDVFFQDYRVNNIYWAMALIGIVFVFAFTMVAVLRKTFDINEKQQQSMGVILGSTFKSIFIMLILSFAMSAILNLTNVTINRIGYIFDNADSLSQERKIYFTDEQYATMARIYNTIGNYSLNPSYTSRYNLNSCYNEIRSDLRYLEQQGVFNLTYITIENGVEVDTWQSVLQELVYAGDTSHELKMDVAYEEISNALLHIMKVLHTNSNFRPLSYYESGYSTINSVSLDRILFLSGTVSAAKNSKYNLAPYLADGLRGAFYIGEKSIYSFDDVKSAFDIGITGINYIFIWVLTYFTIRNLLRCIFGCIMRLFNMVSLYLVAPLTVATMPLDNGEKFKQWITAMTVQGLGILGTIIPMRLIILFAPIILGNNLELFDSVSLSFLAKVLLVVGGLQAVEGFGDVVVGILANNASMQAIRSGDAAKGMADSGFNKLSSAAGSVAKFGGKAAGYTALAGLGLGAGAAVVGVGLGVAGIGLAGAGVIAGGYYGGKKAIQSYRDYKSDKAAAADGASTGGSTGGVGSNGNTPGNGGGIQGGGFNANLNQQVGGSVNGSQQSKPLSKAQFENLFGPGTYDKYAQGQQGQQGGAPVNAPSIKVPPPIPSSQTNLSDLSKQ